MRTFRIAALLFLPFFANVAEANTPERTLRIGFLEFPPLAYPEKLWGNGKTGYVLEILKSVAKNLEIKEEFKEYPYKRVKINLENGKDIDLFMCVPKAYQGKVKENYLMSESLFRITATLFHAKSEPQITNINQLKNKTVIAVEGIEAALSQLSSTNKIDRATDSKNAVDMLSKNRGKYLADYGERILAHMKNAGVTSDFQALELFQMETGFCFTRSWPNAESVLKKIHQNFRAIQASPEGKALAQKYELAGQFGE